MCLLIGAVTLVPRDREGIGFLCVRQRDKADLDVVVGPPETDV